jgi:hypothetical protein
MVFDHAGQHLYISTSDGLVQSYNLSTGTFDPPYTLGGSLNGLDIASDDSFLLVAQNNLQNSQITIHRLSLPSGDVINITYTPPYDESGSGAWDVAIASNGLAMVTSRGGFARVRQIDLSTNAISVRHDVPGSAYDEVTTKTQIHRSADGRRLSFLEYDISSGPIFFYDALTNTFGLRTETDIFTDSAGAAISRDGSLVATRLTDNGAALDTASNLTFVRSFHDADGGVAFDAREDTVYAVNSSSKQIIAYDTNTFVEKFRLDIGEPITAGVTQFDSGNLIASEDGRFLALSTPSGIRLFAIPIGPFPSPTPPICGTPRDIVFDHTGQYLYITTAEGFVWPYNVSTESFGPSYNLGGSLNGVDIAVDDSFLIIAQGYSGIAQGAFQKLDLATGTAININFPHQLLNFGHSTGEWGAWNIAIASNGLAFGTTHARGGTTFVPLRQIDLSTNILTPRADTPNGDLVSQTLIHRSADRTRLYLLEAGYSDGPVFSYSAMTNTFGPIAYKDSYTSSGAVNRNGTLVGTRLRNQSFATLDALPNFNFVHRFDYLDSGVAFDAVQDAFYGVNSSNDQIVAYDTTTFVEKFRFDIGEDVNAGAAPIGVGKLAASQDGRYLALITPTAVRVYEIPAVQLVSVVSRKNHGSGAYDINLPLDGPQGVECRDGGSNGEYTVVFTFGLNLTHVAGASLTQGIGMVTSANIDSNDPHRYVVNLSGIANAQYIRVTVSGVTDTAGNHTDGISQQMGVLVGDTNGDGTVNAADVAQTKSRLGQTVDALNFRSDVNANGSINAADVALVKSSLGTGLP